MPVLNSLSAAATRALASALAAAMSFTVLANRLSLRALAAFRDADMRLVADLSMASAWARSAAILARTRRNCAAVLAITTLSLLLAHWRIDLSWARIWEASLERPRLASARALAVFLSNRLTAFSRALRAALAFSLIWAAFAATCLLVCVMR